MAQQRRSKILWSKSFPTTVSSQSALYTCTFGERERDLNKSRDRAQKLCNKTFSRQCDLRRHEKIHTRPFKCEKCIGAFPSQKDLQRHDSSCHGQNFKYLCCYKDCHKSFTISEYMKTYRRNLYGYTRKDHWQKHMRRKHNLSRAAIKDVQKKGIPMMEWRGEFQENGMPVLERKYWGGMSEKGEWVPVIPVDSATAGPETIETLLPRNTNTPATKSSEGIDPVLQLLGERAGADPGLKKLMGKVANGEETLEELQMLHKHIDELRAAQELRPQSRPNALD